MSYSFDPIGIVHSPFKEKFGIPRQAGLMAEARATVEILPPYDRQEAFSGLDRFSHIWLVFVFHGSIRSGWRPTVRPPRLGGNRRVGVFATRSGFRPNPIGMSAVTLEKISLTGPGAKKGVVLYVAGIDLLDGTPVLDIKPYLPYADTVPGADGGFAAERPPGDLAVAFSPQAREACLARQAEVPGLMKFIVGMLKSDPRPAYCQDASDGRRFGARIFDVDVQWEYRKDGILVTAVAG